MFKAFAHGATRPQVRYSSKTSSRSSRQSGGHDSDINFMRPNGGEGDTSCAFSPFPYRGAADLLTAYLCTNISATTAVTSLRRGADVRSSKSTITGRKRQRSQVCPNCSFGRRKRRIDNSAKGMS